MKIDIKTGIPSRVDRVSSSAVSGAEITSANSTTVAAPGAASIEGGFSRKEAYSIILESLLKILDRKSQVQTSILPLLQLLKQIPSGKDGLPADTSDRRLLMSVLKQWRELHTPKLPGKIISDFENLEKILQGERRDNYLLILKELPDQKLPALMIREEQAREKKSKDSPEKWVKRLDLIFSLIHLGSVRVILEKQGERRTCLIQCEDTKGHRIIRTSLFQLRERLLKKGLVLSRLKVQKKPISHPFTEESQESHEEGVTLWV